MTQETVTVDIGALIQAKIDRYGVDLPSLPLPSVYNWFKPDTGYSIFRLKEAHPWDASMIVHAMFRDDDEIRIYAVPGPNADPKTAALRRFVLSKRHPCYEVEIFNVEAYAQAIADEWVVVAAGMTTPDAEREKIVEYLKDKGYHSVAQAIENGDHLEEEEEEPAPANVPVSNGAPLVTPPPSPDLPPTS